MFVVVFVFAALAAVVVIGCRVCSAVLQVGTVAHRIRGSLCFVLYIFFCRSCSLIQAHAFETGSKPQSESFNGTDTGVAPNYLHCLGHRQQVCSVFDLFCV